MNVRKSNPLNSLYALWVRLGGKATPDVRYEGHELIQLPQYNDNLCHFMRVVLIWVWFRWLFKRRQMFTYIKGGIYISPFLIGSMSFLSGMFVGAMIHWPEFRKVIITMAVGVGLVFGAAYLFMETVVGDWIIDNQQAGMARRRRFWGPKREAFNLFKDWLYAKKMRVCPQIKVDL